MRKGKNLSSFRLWHKVRGGKEGGEGEEGEEGGEGGEDAEPAGNEDVRVMRPR